jgi:CPA2 family monovalent cation:H+ antiporter-2
VVARRLGLPGGTELVGERPAVEERADHVVIVGFGVGGRQLARVMREASIRYVVVELAGEVARAARAEGEPVLFGDATRTEILRQAGVERARVAVFAISDRDAVRRAVIAARALAPRLVLVVRTRRVADLETLAALGADEVVAEEFESSIELFARVLAHYHVPRHVIDAQERVLRGDRYRGLRSALAGEQVSAAALEALAAGTVDVFRVTRGARAAGRTIRELEVRRATGATILALVRDGAPISNPSPDQRLEAGDSLVLVGSHAEIEHAFRLLDRPTETPAPEGT